MTTFNQCSNCFCKKEDTIIFKCLTCETVYCEICSDKGWIEHKCPKCHSGIKNKLGSIKH